jgi:hypothetical protein
MRAALILFSSSSVPGETFKRRQEIFCGEIMGGCLPSPSMGEAGVGRTEAKGMRKGGVLGGLFWEL